MNRNYKLTHNSLINSLDVSPFFNSFIPTPINRVKNRRKCVQVVEARGKTTNIKSQLVFTRGKNPIVPEMIIRSMVMMSLMERRKDWPHVHTLLNNQTKECFLDHFVNVYGNLNAIAFDPTMIQHL